MDDQQWRPYQSDDDSEFLTRGDIKTAAQVARANETLEWLRKDYLSGAPQHEGLWSAVTDRMLRYAQANPDLWPHLQAELGERRRGDALKKVYDAAHAEVEQARSAQPQQSVSSERVIRASDFEPTEQDREAAQQESVDRYNRARRSPMKKE